MNKPLSVSELQFLYLFLLIEMVVSLSSLICSKMNVVMLPQFLRDVNENLLEDVLASCEVQICTAISVSRSVPLVITVMTLVYDGSVLLRKIKE